MAIEEILRPVQPQPKVMPKSSLLGKPTLNARESKNNMKPGQTLSEIKAARASNLGSQLNQGANLSKSSVVTATLDSKLKTRNTRNERLQGTKPVIATKESTKNPFSNAQAKNSGQAADLKSEGTVNSSSDQSQLENSNLQSLEDSNIMNSEVFSESQSLTESVLLESVDESRLETPKKLLKSDKPATQAAEGNQKGDANEEKDSTKGLQMFKEIENQFKQALKLVEELEKAAGGNPCSKLTFKKELTKLLTACKSKAKRVP